MLEEAPLSGPQRVEEEDIIRKAAGIAYAGGSDTVSLVSSNDVVQALMLHFVASDSIGPAVVLYGYGTLSLCTEEGPSRA